MLTPIMGIIITLTAIMLIVNMLSVIMLVAILLILTMKTVIMADLIIHFDSIMPSTIIAL
jgi:hypothetical protein